MNHPSNRTTLGDLQEIFTYHAPTEQQVKQMEEIRGSAHEMSRKILNNCPGCADTTAAVRKVREAVMTANAAIVLEPEEPPA